MFTSSIRPLVVLAIVSVLTSTSAVPVRNNTAIRIPLVHSTRNLQYAGHARDNFNITQLAGSKSLKINYNDDANSRDFMKRAGSERYKSPIKFQNQNYVYYVPVMVGTPPRMYRMVPDTGSANLWVISANSKDKSQYHNGNTYDASQSTSSEDLDEDFSVRYLGDKVKTTDGKLYTDIISLGNLIIERTPIGAVTTLGDQFMDKFFVDGVLALGRPLQSTIQHPTLMQTIVNNQLSNQAQFSITLVDPRLEGLVEEQSELVLGDINVGDDRIITWYNVVSNQQWIISLHSVSVSADGQNFVAITDTKAALIDTGATYLVGNLKQIRDLHMTIPGSVEHPVASNNVVHFSIPCDTQAVVKLSFGIKSYKIFATQLHLGLQTYDQNMCFSGIAGMETIKEWVIGQTFLHLVDAYFSESGTPIGECTVGTCIGFSW